MPAYLDSGELAEGVGPQYQLMVVWDTRMREQLNYPLNRSYSETWDLYL